jgi:hypothetical protein
MTEKLRHRVRLVLGDWSNDGHGRVDHQIIASNLSGAEIEQAYKLGTKQLGFDFRANICSGYEDHRVSIMDAARFRELGCGIFEEFEEFEFDEKGGYSLNREDFVTLFLFLCTLGRPGFCYELVTDTMDSINIGGYGLF